MRCKRKTPELNPTPMRTKNGRIVLRSTCRCGTNKSRHMSRIDIEGRGFGGIIISIPLTGPLLKGIIGTGAGKELRLPGKMGGGK